MRTVSRKLPTISATATIIPVATESAALATDVRRSDAGNDAAASRPTMPNVRSSTGDASREVTRTIAGASKENPATTQSTATYPATAIPSIGGKREINAAAM